MIPDSVTVVLLLSLVASWVYIRRLQALQALAYLDGFIDGRRTLCDADLQQTSQPGEVYDWERDGL